MPLDKSLLDLFMKDQKNWPLAKLAQLKKLDDISQTQKLIIEKVSSTPMLFSASSFNFTGEWKLLSSTI